MPIYTTCNINTIKKTYQANFQQRSSLICGMSIPLLVGQNNKASEFVKH